MARPHPSSRRPLDLNCNISSAPGLKSASLPWRFWTCHFSIITLARSLKSNLSLSLPPISIYTPRFCRRTLGSLKNPEKYNRWAGSTQGHGQKVKLRISDWHIWMIICNLWSVKNISGFCPKCLTHSQGINKAMGVFSHT